MILSHAVEPRPLGHVSGEEAGDVLSERVVAKWAGEEVETVPVAQVDPARLAVLVVDAGQRVGAVSLQDVKSSRIKQT